MTQDASSTSVLGDFTHGSLEYGDIRARMRRDEQGRFTMDFTRLGGAEHWSAVVVRSVGSRRYQQYLARDQDLYYRLPVAWNIGEQRFMHMNGAFLTPDPSELYAGGSIERADYDRHVTRWNDNCVYCHNVAPTPGLDPVSGRFDTRVAELGIACEACHGPGERHVAHNHDPLRRFMLHLGLRPDPTIADPARLSPERSAQICGHCHGQRLAPNIEQVHETGDRFVPGEDLARYSRPLAQDTKLNGEQGVFAARFWPDGTARLTAYEYQGLLQSACAKRGGLTCTSCHGMHEGDPHGQLRPLRLEDAACTGCHTQLASDAAKASHSHHPATSAGARCLGCHMPRVVYGLVGVHRSHRIDAPRPDVAPEIGRPDACSLCHTDKSRDWSAAALAGWSGKRRAPHADENAPPEVQRLLFAGDPIERAVAADALGVLATHTTRAAASQHAGLLIDALERDRYPAVRSIAWQALRTLLAANEARLAPDLAAFTATDTPEARAREIAAIVSTFPVGSFQPAPDALRALRARASEQPQISIGE
jgi:predicted CXXCH cytochrome family protein